MRSFQSTFANGQISAQLAGQIESAAYKNGAREVLNGAIAMQGGVTRRPGSRRRAVLTGGETRIIGQVYSRTEAVVLALAPGRLTVYDPEGAQLALFTGSSCPWTSQTLWFLDHERFGNLTLFTDQSFRPRVLRRTGPGSFTLSEFAWDVDLRLSCQPYHKFAAHDVTLTPSGTTGSITLTASEPFWETGHVGLRVRIRDSDATITARLSSTVAQATLSKPLTVVADLNPFTTSEGRERVNVTLADHGLDEGDDFTISGANDVGERNPNGAWVVQERINRDRFSFQLDQNAVTTQTGGGPSCTFALRSPTRDWSEPAFSEVRGWPQTACVHQGRLWFAGGPELGDGAFASRPQSLFDFSAGEGAPDDGVKAIAETQSNGIRHLVSADDLLVLGDAGEAIIPSRDAPIEQATVRGRSSTKLGCAYVKPLPYDGAVLFADVLGQHIYETVYSDEMTGYVATPLSLLCPELIDAPIQGTRFKGSAKQATPCCLWVMKDGSIAVFTARRAEGAAGWAKWTTHGAFPTGGYVSVTGLNERLYAVARRRVDGVTQYWLEEFDWSYGRRADGMVTMEDPSATEEWAGCPFGGNVEIDVQDHKTGEYVGRFTTDEAGGFVLPGIYTDIRVGLPFTFRLETLPPALVIKDGDTLGDVRAISRVVTEFKDTTHCTVDGEVVTARLASDLNGKIIPLSGPIETRQLGSSRAPTVRIECALPERVTVLGALVEVEFT